MCHNSVNVIKSRQYFVNNPIPKFQPRVVDMCTKYTIFMANRDFVALPNKLFLADRIRDDQL